MEIVFLGVLWNVYTLFCSVINTTVGMILVGMVLLGLVYAIDTYIKSSPDRAKRAKAQKRKKVLEEIKAARTVSDPNIALVNNPDVIVGVNPNMDYELQAGIGLKLMAFVSLALSGYGIYMGLAYLVAL